MFLYQSAHGYCYNSDSIFLYDFVRRFSPRGRVLDIGCGVGILSLLLHRDFHVETTLVDKQEKMLTYARHNFAVNGFEVTAHLGDIVDFSPEQTFDYVISNPPFYDKEVIQSDNEVLNAARYTHHMPLEVLIGSAKRALGPRGYLVFCYDAKRIDNIAVILKENKLTMEAVRFVHPKEDREAKIVMVAARVGSRAMTKVLPPLIVFDAQNSYRSEAQAAFEHAATHSIKGEL